VNLGFNSDIRLGDALLHVQTEDRGAHHPLVDTTVYAQGQVLHRRTTNYQDLFEGESVNQAALAERVERQHREVIEELRSGRLKLGLPAAAPQPPAAPPSKLAVQLLNPASWLAAGAATLQIEVREKTSGEPAAFCNIEVTLEGAQEPALYLACTDSQGRAELSFPLPQLSPEGAALVIRAVSASGNEEIRYQLRPKARASASRVPAK